MNRRPLALLVLVITSMVLSACADIAAPQPKHECSGWVDSTGKCIEQ